MEYEFQDKVEDNLKSFRLKLFKPLLEILTKWKVLPNYITFVCLILSFLCFYSLINAHFVWSVICFFVYFICDSLDGTLARFQKNASDKGKFFDMFTDNVFATLLVLGFIKIGVLNSLNGAVFIYLMLIVLLLGIMLTSRRYKTDWLFHPRAGFLAQSPRYIVYLFYVLWVFNWFWNLDSLVLLLNVYFGVLAIIYFVNCMHLESGKKR